MARRPVVLTGVLATYGMTSGAAAAFTGCVVFREVDAWNIKRQLLLLVIGVAYCWGMGTLGSLSVAAGGDDASPSKQASRTGARSGGIEMSEQIPNDTAPLLPFATDFRNVDEDALMEDRLLAQALAPERLQQVIGEAMAVPPTEGDDLADLDWAQTWQTNPGGNEGWDATEGGFDADFEELMRRFDEGDKNRSNDCQQAIRLGRSGLPSAALFPGSPNAQICEEEDKLLQGIVDLEL